MIWLWFSKYFCNNSLFINIELNCSSCSMCLVNVGFVCDILYIHVVCRSKYGNIDGLYPLVLDNSTDCFGMLKCRGHNMCVAAHQVCDGQPQCPRGDDEKWCQLATTCPSPCTCDGLSINCSAANLRSIPNMSHNSWRKVDLSRNRITHLETFSSVYMKYLNLSYNRFTSIHGSFSMLHSMEVLDISHGHLWEIQATTFAGLERLKYLYLAGNPLVVITLAANWKSPFNAVVDIGNNITQCCILDKLQPHQCRVQLEKLLTDCTHKIKFQSFRVLPIVLGCVGILGNIHQFLREQQRRKDVDLRFILICYSIISSFMMCVYQLVIGVTSYTSSQPILDSTYDYIDSSVCRFLFFFIMFCSILSMTSICSLAVLVFVLPSVVINVSRMHLLVKLTLILGGLVHCLFPLSMGLYAMFNYDRYRGYLDVLCHPMKVLFSASWDHILAWDPADTIHQVVFGTILGVSFFAGCFCLGCVVFRCLRNGRQCSKEPYGDADQVSLSPRQRMAFDSQVPKTLAIIMITDLLIWTTISIICE